MEGTYTKTPKKRSASGKRTGDTPPKGDSIVAIDPGSSGGFCHIDARNRRILATHQMPKGREWGIDTRLFRDEIEKMMRDNTRIVIEQVPFTIGAVGNSASEFKLGMAYGQAMGVLYDKELNFITPRKWQGVLGLSSDKKKTIEWVRANFQGFDKCLGSRGGVLNGLTDAVAIGYAWWKLQQKEKADESGIKLFFKRRAREGSCKDTEAYPRATEGSLYVP